MNSNHWSVAGIKLAVGQNYGRLTVVDIYREKSRVRLKCRCSCGTLFKTQARHVVKGATTSCGCYNKEITSRVNKDARRKEFGWASFNNLYHTYRAQARRRGCQMTLTRNQFKQLTTAPCHYCGSAPNNEHCTGYGSYRYNGLDRVDNKAGYTIENVVPCCLRCNKAKGTSTVLDFNKWLEALYAHMKKNGGLSTAALPR